MGYLLKVTPVCSPAPVPCGLSAQVPTVLLGLSCHGRGVSPHSAPVRAAALQQQAAVWGVSSITIQHGAEVKSML